MFKDLRNIEDMKIEFQDRIDDYLLDRMSDEERKSFESDAAADAELKEQLQFTETVQQATKSRNEKLAAMKEWKDDYIWEDERMAAASAAEYRPTGSGYNYCPAPSMDETRSMTRSSGRKLLYWISGIAAMLVVGFFLIQNLYVANSPNEYMPSPRMNDMTSRAGADNSDIELLLNQKKYDVALDLIEEKYLAVQDDSLDIVLDESIEAEQKEYDMQIVKDKQDELKWLKAHALLGLGRQETALRILDELRNEEGYYQMAADSLYKRILK